ncbi:MAG: lysophospholipid acyltransferase family protein [Terrimicrobiaceae bacterium]
MSLRYWVEAAGLRAGQRLVQNLPFDFIRPLARLLGNVVCLADARGRKVAMANLAAAFPGKYTPAEMRRIARLSYGTFARTMLELFWAPNWSREFFESEFEFEGLENGPHVTDPGRGGIYACFHFSNFESLSLISPYCIVAGPVIAQRFRNPLIGPVFDRLRASTGMQAIPQERALVRMLKLLQGGGRFGMLTDLNIDPREGSVVISAFGGLLTSVTPAHVALAQRTNSLVVPLECRPLPGGRYKVIYHPPIECPKDADPLPLVQRSWDVLEKSIHEMPECWLWAYKHWRFRPSGGDTSRYPFYANHAKRFDRAVVACHPN